MIMSLKRRPRILSADVLAAAMLTLLTLTAASAATLDQGDPASPPAAAVVGSGDDGMPPSPGPTDPNGP
jgi:hypothetical protein